MRVLEVEKDSIDVCKLFKHKTLEDAQKIEQIGEIKEVCESEYPPLNFFWLMEIKDRLKIYKATF